MVVDAMLMDAMPGDAGDLQSLSAEEFLRTVGRRVRQHRSLSRMSRKRLAELSGVSERYLAQLESGQGNMSIILLRRVSTAISLPLDILMSDQGPTGQSNASSASETEVERRPDSTSFGSLHDSSMRSPILESSPRTDQEPVREPVREPVQASTQVPLADAERVHEFG